MGKSLNKTDQNRCKTRTLAFFCNIMSRVLRHMRQNSVMWISLTAFLLIAWLFTSSICVFRSIFGIPCPGCGLTRAVLAAMQGNISAAFSAHPLFPLALAALAAVAILMLINPGLLSSRPASIIWIILCAVFIGVYIYRMIVYFPAIYPLTFNETAFVPRILRLIQSFILWLGSS